MDSYIYRLIRFIVLLVGLIPSIICFLLVFFFLFKTKQISYKHLHNHVILVLLFSDFILIITELPMTLVYSYRGTVAIQTNQFCSFWIAYNYGLYDIGLFLMAFGSIERYFLIFHEKFVSRWRFIVHYIPMIIIFIYPLIFYSLMVNIYPCEKIYYYDAYVCGGACYQYELIAGTMDYIINVFCPTVLIILANMILLFRVTYQKRAMKIANKWQKIRLMYIQLVSISMLYFLVWIPFVIISLIRLFYEPLFLQDVTILLINYCLYICPLASPFISLIGLPSVRQRLRRNIWYMLWINQGVDTRIRPTGTIVTRTRQQHMMPRRNYDEHTF